MQPSVATPVRAGTTTPWESMRFGSVDCDFIRPADFQVLLTEWIAAPVPAFHHVVTLNPEMVLRAEHDEEFRQAVGRAELRVPDGSGLVWAQWYIRSQFWSLLPSLLAFPFRAVERVTGVATVRALARAGAKHNASLYLLGGTAEQVRATAALLQRELPQLAVHTAPPHAYDESGPAELIADIQRQRPAALLVAYGAPEQSIWIERHRQSLPSVHVAVGVGGAFAILSEEKPRAPRWLRRRNLEWLWRLALEPSRLPRIWKATVRFPLLITQQKQRVERTQMPREGE